MRSDRRTSIPAPTTTDLAWFRACERTMQWRQAQRLDALRALAVRTASMRWSPRLLRVLLDELHVDGALTPLIGALQSLPSSRFPQAVALAIVLRHSWRPDDFARIAKRLGIAARRPTPRERQLRSSSHSRTTRRRRTSTVGRAAAARSKSL
jgi:hypothetical protein